MILWEKELRQLAGRRPGKSRTRNDQSMYFLLLMVQKSQGQPPEMYETIWDKLPTSTGEFTGFLNHQQYWLY